MLSLVQLSPSLLTIISNLLWFYVCACMGGGGEFPYLILFVPDASPFVAKYFSPGSFKLMFRSVQHEAEAAFS